MLNPHIILYIPVLDYLKPNITGITGITAMIYALNTWQVCPFWLSNM